jgi:hypothetical protein
MLKAPLDPAYAGLIFMVLYMYCVNCASCCAKLTKAVNIKTKENSFVFIVDILSFEIRGVNKILIKP